MQQLKHLINKELYKMNTLIENIEITEPPFLFISEINYMQIFNGMIDVDINNKRKVST